MGISPLKNAKDWTSGHLSNGDTRKRVDVGLNFEANSKYPVRNMLQMFGLENL